MSPLNLVPEADTPLGRRLAEGIARSGPMRLDQFMAVCLGDPAHGYYTTREALGAGGDFTTAPEISQIFGELVGLWMAQTWIDQVSASKGGVVPFALAELGPGRGVLMADMLRASRAVGPFRSALTPHLVEMSPKLRAEQAERLDGAGAIWHGAAGELPLDRPLFLVANEFFDALPIRQWVRQDGIWREQQVHLTDGCFLLTADGAAIDEQSQTWEAALAARFADAPEGAFLESRPDDRDVIRENATRLEAQGVAALFVDYGYDDAARARAKGRDTFQGLRNGSFCDATAWPGQADLTAHVNFDDLIALLPESLVAYGPLTQGAFLFRLGAEARAAQLVAAQPGRAEEIASGLRRLTDGAEMGQLFKVIAVAPRGAPVPPGFEGLPAKGATRSVGAAERSSD